MNYINIFSRYFTPRLRLLRLGRIRRAYYKIVVVNMDNRIVEDLGYILPHSASHKRIKRVGLDRSKCIKWLLKKSIPSLIVFFILENVGLIKYSKLKK
jgi:ribosomal protein S16